MGYTTGATSGQEKKKGALPPSFLPSPALRPSASCTILVSLPGCLPATSGKGAWLTQTVHSKDLHAHTHTHTHAGTQAGTTHARPAAEPIARTHTPPSPLLSSLELLSPHPIPSPWSRPPRPPTGPSLFLILSRGNPFQLFPTQAAYERPHKPSCDPALGQR